jgi:hypothetical protein
MSNTTQAESNQFIEKIIEKIVENNPYGFILRPKLKEKTGGLLHGRTMANRDSEGNGIANRIIVGRVTAYPVESVIEYLKTKIVVND